jgi:hypothetical protein
MIAQNIQLIRVAFMHEEEAVVIRDLTHDITQVTRTISSTILIRNRLILFTESINHHTKPACDVDGVKEKKSKNILPFKS